MDLYVRLLPKFENMGNRNNFSREIAIFNPILLYKTKSKVSSLYWETFYQALK